MFLFRKKVLLVKKHGWRILRSTKKLFFWRSAGRRARWRRRGGGVRRWIDHVRGLSEQCFLPSDPTRCSEYRLETTSVIIIFANTTPINKKVSTQTVNFLLTRNRNQTHQRKHVNTTHKNAKTFWRPPEIMLTQHLTNLTHTHTEKESKPHPAVYSL